MARRNDAISELGRRIRNDIRKLQRLVERAEAKRAVSRKRRDDEDDDDEDDDDEDE